MRLGTKDILAAYTQIFSLAGLRADPDDVLDDVVLLAKAYTNKDDFNAAVASTVRAIELARDDRVNASALRDDLSGWRSHHYQLRRVQGLPADLRLVYR